MNEQMKQQLPVFGLGSPFRQGLDESFERWVGILRFKASEFEHKQPVLDRTRPTLDEICNEMHAFQNGFKSK